MPGEMEKNLKLEGTSGVMEGEKVTGISRSFVKSRLVRLII